MNYATFIRFYQICPLTRNLFIIYMIITSNGISPRQDRRISVVYILKRVVGNSHLTFEELTTIIVQAESVLNFRPIIPLSDNPNDFLAITPGNILIGDCLTAVPQIDVIETPSNHLTQYKKLQQMVPHFWQSWRSEYLQTLQIRTKWKRPSFNETLQAGTLVLLKDENTPPLKWPLGRILSVFPGTDRIIRVVSIKTASGVCKRAITKIFLLPMVIS